MWVFALWGLIGAAATRAVVFIEASQRVKGWPWAPPAGPGWPLFTVTTLMHLGIAAAVTAALSDTHYVPNAAIAFGLGAAAPIVVKKLAKVAVSLLPPEESEDPTELPRKVNSVTNDTLPAGERDEA